MSGSIKRSNRGAHPGGETLNIHTQPKRRNSPEGDLQWIEDSELMDLDLWAGDRIFMKWLDRPGFFSGKFIYKDGQFVDYQVNFYV